MFVAEEAVGQRLGRYRLLERVGEGGCGVVYVAGQTEPVRRRVALKVIMLGIDTKTVVARFEVERQAMAMPSGRPAVSSRPYICSYSCVPPENTKQRELTDIIPQGGTDIADSSPLRRWVLPRSSDWVVGKVRP